MRCKLWRSSAEGILEFGRLSEIAYILTWLVGQVVGWQLVNKTSSQVLGQFLIYLLEVVPLRSLPVLGLTQHELFTVGTNSKLILLQVGQGPNLKLREPSRGRGSDKRRVPRVSSPSIRALPPVPSPGDRFRLTGDHGLRRDHGLRLQKLPTLT